MEARKVVSNEKVEANTGKIAFERGPLVYCAEEVDQSWRGTFPFGSEGNHFWTIHSIKLC